ncbi:MAG TPA: glycosyltransferase family 39 protein [Planctomycetota bacterium]|nr:glycosyltransferase family 39 protein [Planctomycetota bacterium]
MRPRTGLWLAIAVGVAARLALVLAFPRMPLVSDERDYVEAADALLRGEQDPWLLFHPPLYTAFCAAIRALAGPSDDAIRLAQCLLEGGTILGVWLLARRAFDERVALVAAWIWALHPEFISYSHYLWSECVALALLVWALHALLMLRERPGTARAVWAGCAWGAASLIKPYNLYLLPLLLAGLVCWPGLADRARAARLAAVALGVCVLAVLPWSLHVSAEKGRPVVICTVAELSLETGTNRLPPPQFDWGTTSTTSGKQIRSDPDRRKGGVLAFIAENPGLFAGRAAEKLGFLWSPNSYLLRCLYGHEKYGPPRAMPAGARLAAAGATLLASAILTVGLVVGFCFSKPGVFHVLAALYSLAYMGMITLTPSFSRYRLMLMVFAAVFSAAWWAGRVSFADLEHRQRPLVLALVCGFGLVVVWAVRLPPVLEQVW